MFRVRMSVLFVFLSIYIFGQSEKEKNIMHEEKDMPYVLVDKHSMPRTPAYTYRNTSIFTTQVNIDADGNNIVGDAGNEPSIAIDPTNPNRIVIGWRQFDNINNNFRQAGYAYTTDAGNTWTFPGPIDAGVFRSDPVLDSDINGNFYYNSLSIDGGMHCTVYRIEDAGVEWDDGTYAYGGDKQWMRIDKTSSIGQGHNYSFWSSFFSACTGSFTRSTDLGDSYEECMEVSGDPRWGTLAVGSEGELYIVGAGDYIITLVKSSNAKDASESVSWDFTTSVNLDGVLSTGSINPEGLIGQAWVATDISSGDGEGNVYVLASVERTGASDPADVMFAKSTNGGVSFGSPIRINTDVSTTNYQWFGTMSVAPNGRIDVVWLDTRDAPADSPHNSALYYSYSIDQGETWSDNKQLSDYFDPHIGYPEQDKMGDYFDMKSDNSGAHLAWSNTLNGGEDVYYSHIVPDYLDVTDISNDILEVSAYPNPFSTGTNISFSIREEADVALTIYDVLGRKVKHFNDESMISGTHEFYWDGKNEFGNIVAKGIYYYNLRVNGTMATNKLLHK